MDALEEIRGRWQAATPGPWEAYRNDREVNMWVLSGDGALECNLGYLGNRPENDATAIAHAPSDVARLLAAVEGVLALADALESEATASENTAKNILDGQPNQGWVRVAMQHENHVEVARNHAARIREAITTALGGSL